MKQKLMRTPPQHKILQGESQKLKQKLDSLKKQIQAKKKEKQLTKSAQSNQLKLGQSHKSSNTITQTSQDLYKLLANLKLDSIVARLKEKRIFTVEQLDRIKAEELENWKDIAVGYRIKLKKYLWTKQTNLSQSRKTSVQKSPVKAGQISVEKDLKIEQIVKNRKQGQKYIPIKRNNQQIQFSDQKQLVQQQQEFMIKSLKTAFNFHKNNLEQVSSSGNLQLNIFSDELSQLKYQQPVHLVKTAISQSRVQKYQSLPNYKYCWTCLKMVKQNTILYNSRQFCSQSCLEDYKQNIQIQNQNNFFQNIQDTEKQFQKHIYDRYVSELQGVPRKQKMKRNAIQVEIEDLDLQIE